MTVGGKDILINCGDGVVDKYEVERPYQGFQLFCKHAFRGFP